MREEGIKNIDGQRDEANSKPELTRTCSCIRMLELLYSRNVVSIAELAQELGTNPRNIPEYKKELTYAGYIIESVPGRYGGYRLNKRSLFPSVKLDGEEQDALMGALSYLLERKDYLQKPALSRAIGKLAASCERSRVLDGPLVIDRYPLSMTEHELEERFKKISQCIAEKRVIRLSYLPQTNITTDYDFAPYKLFLYHDSWYMIGMDECANQIIYMKLNRIQTMTVTNRVFRIPLTYSESEYLDDFGMKQFGDWYTVKLRITGTFAMLVRERVYGKNQTIECIDPNTTMLTCDMQNADLIESFVLSLGAHCTVLEPAWLRERIYKTATFLTNSIYLQEE